MTTRIANECCGGFAQTDRTISEHVLVNDSVHPERSTVELDTQTLCSLPFGPGGLAEIILLT